MFKLHNLQGIQRSNAWKGFYHLTVRGISTFITPADFYSPQLHFLKT